MHYYSEGQVLATVPKTGKTMRFLAKYGQIFSSFYSKFIEYVNVLYIFQVTQWFVHLAINSWLGMAPFANYLCGLSMRYNTVRSTIAKTAYNLLTYDFMNSIGDEAMAESHYRDFFNDGILKSLEISNIDTTPYFLAYDQTVKFGKLQYHAECKDYFVINNMAYYIMRWMHELRFYLISDESRREFSLLICNLNSYGKSLLGERYSYLAPYTTGPIVEELIYRVMLQSLLIKTSNCLFNNRYLSGLKRPMEIFWILSVAFLFSAIHKQGQHFDLSRFILGTFFGGACARSNGLLKGAFLAIVHHGLTNMIIHYFCETYHQSLAEDIKIEHLMPPLVFGATAITAQCLYKSMKTLIFTERLTHAREDISQDNINHMASPAYR